MLIAGPVVVVRPMAGKSERTTIERAEVKLLVKVGEGQHLSKKKTWVDEVHIHRRSLKTEVEEACQIVYDVLTGSMGNARVAKAQP